MNVAVALTMYEAICSKCYFFKVCFKFKKKKRAECSINTVAFELLNNKNCVLFYFFCFDLFFHEI